MSPSPLTRLPGGPLRRNTAQTSAGLSVPVASTFPFSPMALRPMAWFDAADASTITSSSGAVSQWDDKSGNGRHVSQGTAAARPTTGANTQNGLNVLTFDGGDRLSLSASAIDSDMTIVSLFKVTTATSFTMPGFSLSSGNQPRPIDRWHATFANNIYIALNAVGVSGNLRGWTSFKSWSCTYQKTTTFGPRWVEYDNNVQVSSVTNTGVHDVTDQVLSIGARIDNGTTLNGQMAELMIFPTVLSSAQRADVHRYLVTKWGL